MCSRQSRRKHQATKQMKLISFILPVYQNRESLKASCLSIINWMELKHPDLKFEIILVNDGSNDGSLEEIISLSEKDERIRGISFSRNFGQVAALVAGARNCRGEAAIFMSADQQDPIELVSEMILAWQNKSEIVIAHRSSRNDTLSARLVSGVFYRIQHAINTSMPKGGFDFVLLDRAPLEVYNALKESKRFFQDDILWLGFTIRFIPYERAKRNKGVSQWTFQRKFDYALNAIISTTKFPIRLMSLLGILSLTYGIYLAVWQIGFVYFNGDAINSADKISSLICLVGGLLMLMLGYLGEYLFRLLQEGKQRPTYVIKEKIGF